MLRWRCVRWPRNSIRPVEFSDPRWALWIMKLRVEQKESTQQALKEFRTGMVFTVCLSACLAAILVLIGFAVRQYFL